MSTIPPEASSDDRRLIEEIARHIAALRQTRSEPGTVLLDVHVAGIRCVLMRPSERPPRERLTAREMEIARLVALGQSNKEIACALTLSVWTVAGYLRRIFAKLAVGSRAEMVARLLELG